MALGRRLVKFAKVWPPRHRERLVHGGGVANGNARGQEVGFCFLPRTGLLLFLQRRESFVFRERNPPPALKLPWERWLLLSAWVVGEKVWENACPGTSPVAGHRTPKQAGREVNKRRLPSPELIHLSPAGERFPEAHTIMRRASLPYS